MDSYLAPMGAFALQQSLAMGLGLNPITITGSQVGSTSNFVPVPAMMEAQGLLIDNKTNAASVKITPVHLHELILTVIVDQTYEFTSLGNVLIFADGQPLLWQISRIPLPKLKTDGVAHYAGDKYYFPVLIRYPYIKQLITIDESNLLAAKFPVYDSIDDLVIPHQNGSDQAIVERNVQYFGDDHPFIASRSFNDWLSMPIMKKIDDTKFIEIDGGTTEAGM